MGGKVLGVAKHPFPGVTDFSGFLLTAKASGAQVIAFANGGADIVNCMKQARELDCRRAASRWWRSRRRPRICTAWGWRSARDADVLAVLLGP